MKRPKLAAAKTDVVIRRTLAEVLEPVGFSWAGSKIGTFHRQAGADIWHLIRPVRRVGLPQYEVQVFPHSPRIEPRFQELFPDDLSPPTDAWHKLHPTEGVGLSQEWYGCRTEEILLRDFAERVKPALLAHALPYLDRIATYEDLRPLILSPYYREQARSSD
jgi:hypothetical protein